MKNKLLQESCQNKWEINNEMSSKLFLNTTRILHTLILILNLKLDDFILNLLFYFIDTINLIKKKKKISSYITWLRYASLNRLDHKFENIERLMRKCDIIGVKNMFTYIMLVSDVSFIIN